MERLSPLDAAFLESEDADPSVSMAIASVAIFDGSPPALDDLVDRLRCRLPLIPRYGQRVWRAPFDLTAPMWVNDPHFDIRAHVRRAALPAPGGAEELNALIARAMGERLERNRPLWETWLVEGLAGGQWALISKVHHCMVDGVGGTELYHLLLTPTPEWTDTPILAEPPREQPSSRRVLGSAGWEALTAPLREAALGISAIRHPRHAVDLVATTARGLLASAHVLLDPTAGSSLSGTIGAARRYGATVVPLSEVKEIAHRLGVTVNDVAVAAAAGGFRELLTSRGEPCRRNSVRTLVPVSVRPAGDNSGLANKVSCMFTDLPVHLETPLARLRDVHEQLAAAKAHHEAEAGEALVELGAHQPFAVVGPLMRGAFHLPQRSLVTVTTNVPGPRDPLYLMGRRLRRLLPYVPIADRVRFGVAMLSYCDELAFGVTADFTAGADLDRILDGIRSDLDALRLTRRRALA